jgi:selenocysteine-specific elongation factor
MLRDLILGTAGHNNHGKTSLLKALAGVDHDRLSEEKTRGISIDFGIAPLDLGELRLGIVDVPGQERFIKDMLAGTTGVDLAVLVVAANDSVMPQTREHFEILKLLGLRGGAIALTKCDLVDDAVLAVVEADIRNLVRGSFLENAPLIRTSTHNGRGIDEMKAALAEVSRQVEGRTAVDWCRLPIEGSFLVEGQGTVVTGSVLSGRLRVGDEVEWLPGGARLRVLALQNHGEPVDEVRCGMRAAVNLAGLDHRAVARGQELATPGYLAPSRVVTARLLCLASAPQPIQHRAEIRFHIGTREALGAVSLLDCDAIAPGQWGLAQVFLADPITASWGQPFVVRASSAPMTLGGGRILQPVAKKIRFRHREVLERIERLWTGDEEARVLTAAWFGGFAGLATNEFVRNADIPIARAREVVGKLSAERKIVEIELAPQRVVLLHANTLEALQQRILAALAELHEQMPLVTAHDRSKIFAKLAYLKDDALVNAGIDRLVSQRRLLADGRRVARLDFQPKLSVALRRLKDDVVEAFQKAGFQPPEVAAFAHRVGGHAANLKDLFDVCVAEGLLVAISDTVYLHADVEAEMRQRVRERLQTGTGATVAEIRDLLATTRKFAVPFCEYLDRMMVTRRVGNLRFLAEPRAPAEG